MATTGRPFGAATHDKTNQGNETKLTLGDARSPVGLYGGIIVFHDAGIVRHCQGPGKQKSRACNRRAGLHERFVAAWRDFDAIIDLIKYKYDVRRICQGGSLLDKKTFGEISDIDIGMEGCNRPEQFLAMYGDADRLTAHDQ